MRSAPLSTATTPGSTASAQPWSSAQTTSTDPAGGQHPPELAVREERHVAGEAAQLRQQRWLLRVSGFFVGMLLSNLFLLISYLINR